jgi:hypothetical protein
MADNPKHVEKFISYSSVQAKRGLWRSILADRIEYAKHLIANNYKVDPDRVVSIFLSAWDKSTKDYPSPKYARPQNSTEWLSFNEYILYLWKYYVEDTQVRKKPPKEPDQGTTEDKSSTDQTPPPGKERLYDGVGEGDLVDEDVDERILKLLGIDDVFDIDYATYLSLLRERMVAARMSGSNIPSEEAELLTNEWKRVKGKVGRFRIRKKNVNTEGFGGGGPLAIRTGSFFVAQKVAFPEKTEQDTKLVGLAAIAEDIAAIRKSVESIVDLMTQQFSTLRKQMEQDRRRREGKQRADKENLLEKSGKAALALAKKMLSPVQSLLDRIIQFLTTVFLGHLVLKLWRWLANPENKAKLDTILRFIKDWWPALLAAFVLFGTSAGSLIRTVIGTLTKLTITMARKGIPMLLNFLRKNPYVAGALAVTGLAIAANEITGQRQAAPLQADQKAKAQRGEGVYLRGTDTGIDKSPSVGDLGPVTPTGMIQGASGGGKILNLKPQPTKPEPMQLDAFTGGAQITEESGVPITGAGKDTQLVAARPGEIIISKEAVDKHGANFFLRLNKSGGGTNIPRMVNNVQLASGGGLVGGFMDWWNKGRNARVPNENTARFGGLQQYFKKSPNPMTLFGDDKLQITKSNKAFKAGATGYRGWNPFKAFTPNMVKTGPTPAIRQAVERPIRAIAPLIPQAGRMLKFGGALAGPLLDAAFPEPAFNPTLDDARRMGYPMGPQSSSPTRVLPRPNTNLSTNIPAPPEHKITITTATINQAKRIKQDKSVGMRGVDAPEKAYYPSTTRSKLASIYGIRGVALT